MIIMISMTYNLSIGLFTYYSYSSPESKLLLINIIFTRLATIRGGQYPYPDKFIYLSRLFWFLIVQTYPVIPPLFFILFLYFGFGLGGSGLEVLLSC